MYQIASAVSGWLQQGVPATVAWAVETHGFSARDHGEAFAVAANRERIGTLLSGALDGRVAELADPAHGSVGRLVELQVSAHDAASAGLSCGGVGLYAVVPATELPERLWPLLLGRAPLAMITRREGGALGSTSIVDGDATGALGEVVARLTHRSVGGVVLLPDAVVTALRPVPRLVIVGAGAIAVAVADAATLLGWSIETTSDLALATTALRGLTASDKALVISHDVELAGPALAAALAGSAGYIAALGARHTQLTRADWLATRGLSDLSRVHGPAGLDVGASTPGEIAVSILAEALAVGSGRGATPLRSGSGPIHAPG